jgi:predicted nuclease with RNAse H fold
VDVVVIDAPLTLPPCVACPLPCPGTRDCRVPEVVMMREAWDAKRRQESDERVSLGQKADRREKRIRIPQPYLDRAYEVFARNHYEHPMLSGTFEIEAALGSNRAPVTARARRLRRELLARFPGVLILETNPALATLGWSLTTGYKVASLLEMKSSQSGRSARAGLLKRLEQQQIALRGAALHEQLFTDFAVNATVFHAAMAALTGWGLFSGEISLHEDFLKLDVGSPFLGWACVPKEAANYAWGH